MKKTRITVTILIIILACLLTSAVSMWFTGRRYARVYENMLSEERDATRAALDAAGDYSLVLEAARVIEDNYIGDVDKAGMAEGAVAGLLDGLGDQWSYYVPLDSMTEYTDSGANTYVGIGVTVTKRDGEGLIIKTVSAGSGAREAGLIQDDVIIAASGIELYDLTLNEAKELIIGEEGTSVTLTVIKATGETLDIPVERRTIELESVKGELIGSVGYVAIDNFHAGVAEDFISVTEGLIEDGAAGLVFDVRFNGGGYLDELVKMLDYLLPEGLLFQSVGRGGDTETIYSEASCVELPMAVLVNESTYSAAEFFAAALREYDWATVVGSQTTGKGYSQIGIPLSDGSTLVLSTREYRTPKGVNLAEAGGLTPDVSVEVTDEEYYDLYLGELAREDDAQLKAALAEAAG